MDGNIELEHIEIQSSQTRDESTDETIWDILNRAPRIEADLFERDKSPAREIVFENP
jgi:hypothetical protein